MLTFRHEGKGEIFYATRHSAGFDICANENVKISAGRWALIGTGLRIVESAGLEDLKVGNVDVAVLPELQIRPRSGLAVKFGISVINSPSTIDADYRGEIKVALINHSTEEFEVHAGDRIAQGVCALVFHAPGLPVKDVERGAGGFGSTGGSQKLT